MNWLWLFLLYVTLCNLLYLLMLIINKAGKTVSIYLGVAAGGMVLLIIAVFKYVLSAEAVASMISFFMKSMGFMPDGTINYQMCIRDSLCTV